MQMAETLYANDGIIVCRFCGNGQPYLREMAFSAAGIVCHGALSRCAARDLLCRRVAGGVSVYVVLHI